MCSKLFFDFVREPCIDHPFPDQMLIDSEQGLVLTVNAIDRLTFLGMSIFLQDAGQRGKMLMCSSTVVFR
jgi:hypothetical protein